MPELPLNRFEKNPVTCDGTVLRSAVPAESVVVVLPGNAEIPLSTGAAFKVGVAADGACSTTGGDVGVFFATVVAGGGVVVGCACAGSLGVVPVNHGRLDSDESDVVC